MVSHFVILWTIFWPTATAILAGESSSSGHQPDQSARCGALGDFATKSLKPLPFSLGEVASGVLTNRVGVPFLLVVGSPTAGGSFATLVFNNKTQEWSKSSQRPFPGDHHCVGVVDNRLYLIGGIGGSAEGTVQRASLQHKASGKVDVMWEKREPMTPFQFRVGTGSGNSAVMGSKIIYCGGHHPLTSPKSWGVPSASSCGVYDTVTDTWETAAPMPAARNHASYCTDGTRLFVFGGRAVEKYDGQNQPLDIWEEQDETMIYTPATNTWTISQPDGSGPARLPIGRGGMGASVYHQGECYVFGGEHTANKKIGAATAAKIGLDHQKNTFYRVDVYNVANNTWRRAQDIPIGLHGISPTKMTMSDCDVNAYIAGGGVRAFASASRHFYQYRLASH